MAVNKQPVLKKCRSLGIEPAYMGVFKKSKKTLDTRRPKKISEYGMQLKEKQKAKFIYGVLEKQFRNYFDVASKRRGVVGENLLRMLELRLDNVIFRLGFARTRREARQVVGHKLVLVNGKRVNIPSYQCKVGDTVEVRDKSKTMQRFKDILDVTGNMLIPEWLTCDRENLRGTIQQVPNREQIDVPVNETLIVELYSK